MDKMNIFLQLKDIYAELVQKGNYEEVMEKLTGGVKINSLVNYYINVVESFEDEDRAIVDNIIRILQEIYNNSDVISPITDEDYDKLYAINLDINKDDIVGATVGNRDGKIISTHKYPDLRGTLDKIHFIRNSEKKPGEKRRSLEDWIKSAENKLGFSLGSKGPVAIEIFPKWDGISGIMECNEDGTVEKSLKRGDTDRNEAEEMTAMFKGTNMKELDPFNDGPFAVKTEIVMTHDNYKRLCEKYGHFKSPRSAVSSIINSKELDRKYLEFLTVIPLQVQNFKTKEIRIPDETYLEYPFQRSFIMEFDDILEAIEILEDKVKRLYGIDIDGIVIRIQRLELQEKLGREGKINKYEVAYKLPPEQAVTVLRDVEFSVGLMGTIAPVAKIEPVKLKGNTISSISLGSIDRFESLDLSEGDAVIIKYDVIPYLEKVPNVEQYGGEKFKTPTHCPYCNEPLVKKPVLKCVNEYCDSRKIGKIMNYVEKMSIPNISIGTITTLFKHKYLNDIEDLYMIEEFDRQIAQLNGFGAVSVQKIIDGINSRRDVFDFEMMGSLGIPNIGRKMFKKILVIYNIDELIKVCKEGDTKKLTQIAGIKGKTAEKIIEGVLFNQELIMFLRKRLNVKRDTRKYTIKVLFTKVRDEEFEKFLDTKDVLVMDSYNKEVDMVIVPSATTTSTKVDKALKAGKDVVPIEDAYKLFGYTK